MQSYIYDVRIGFSKKEMKWTQRIEDNVIREAKRIFEQETMKLRDRVFCFMQENWKEMNQEEIAEALPKKLFRDMISYMLETSNFNNMKENEGADEEEENVKNESARGRKREEPIQKDNDVIES